MKGKLTQKQADEAVKAYKLKPLLPAMDVLTKAAEAISQRGAAYGPPRENLDEVADSWSAITGFKITAKQVAMMFISLKLIRLKRDPNHTDSVVDVIGYAALYACLGDEDA